MSSYRYRNIPEPEKIEALARDLHFFPCSTAEPKTLKPQQIEAFNRDGYLAPLAVFNREEILEVRAYFDRLLERVIAEGGNSYSISTAHATYGGAYDLLKNPRIVAFVQDLLGENVVGWGSHFFCKLPRDGMTVSWHQDASYWPLTPSKAVTVWLAIDDADTENACMRFIPGTHRLGHLDWKKSDDRESNVLNQTVENAEAFGAPVDIELKAGEVSIHSDLLLHSSGPNDSGRRRCGLTLRYCPVDVRAHFGWHSKGVIVSGEDPSDHWADRPRPDKAAELNACGGMKQLRY